MSIFDNMYMLMLSVLNFHYSCLIFWSTFYANIKGYLTFKLPVWNFVEFMQELVWLQDHNCVHEMPTHFLYNMRLSDHNQCVFAVTSWHTDSKLYHCAHTINTTIWILLTTHDVAGFSTGYKISALVAHWHSYSCTSCSCLISNYSTVPLQEE